MITQYTLMSSMIPVCSVILFELKHVLNVMAEFHSLTDCAGEIDSRFNVVDLKVCNQTIDVRYSTYLSAIIKSLIYLQPNIVLECEQNTFRALLQYCQQSL